MAVYDFCDKLLLIFNDIFSDVRTAARDLDKELDMFEVVSLDSSEVTDSVIAAHLALLKKDGNGTNVGLWKLQTMRLRT